MKQEIKKDENIFTTTNYYKPGIFEKLNFLIQKKIKKYLVASKNPLDETIKEIINDKKIIKTLREKKKKKATMSPFSF